MGCSPEDLPEAMNYREKWWERVRDIRASGMTWWWWWWFVNNNEIFQLLFHCVWIPYTLVYWPISCISRTLIYGPKIINLRRQTVLEIITACFTIPLRQVTLPWQHVREEEVAYSRPGSFAKAREHGRLSNLLIAGRGEIWIHIFCQWQLHEVKRKYTYPEVRASFSSCLYIEGLIFRRPSYQTAAPPTRLKEVDSGSLNSA